MSKAARNERRRLQATSYNVIGLAFGAVGVIQSVVAGDLGLESVARMVISALVGYILHRHALRLLMELED